MANLKRIFETETDIYFLKISGRNKYYYKGKKAQSQIWDLSKISAKEFWEEFEKNNSSFLNGEEVNNLTSKDNLEEEQEKKSIFDKSIF